MRRCGPRGCDGSRYRRRTDCHRCRWRYRPPVRRYSFARSWIPKLEVPFRLAGSCKRLEGSRQRLHHAEALYVVTEAHTMKHISMGGLDVSRIGLGAMSMAG